MNIPAIAILAALASAPALGQGEIHTAQEAVTLNTANAQRGYQDLMVHTIVVDPGNQEGLEFLGVRLRAEDADGSWVEREIPAAQAVAESAELAGMVSAGLGVFVDAQVLDRAGLAGMAGHALVLADSASLQPGEGLMMTRIHMSMNFEPVRLVIDASFRDPILGVHTARRTLPVRRHQSTVRYTAPLEGDWLMTSLPSLSSHHRFNPSTEFALDFFRPGADGRGRRREGDLTDANNFLGYGEPVHAAAPGMVVRVIADVVQDRFALSQHPGESDQETGRRIQLYNMRHFQEDFERGAAGNLVVIRHESPAGPEYSAYGHLAAGSVRVAIGAQVARGAVIGAVGDTGDSNAVHLHFQLNRSADVFFSESLPVTIEEIRPAMRGVDPGRFVWMGTGPNE